MRDFRGLEVWQRAHALTLAIYRETRRLPREELYGLTSQLRRAAVSVGSSIAEACGHRSDREVARYFQIARSSASEVDYQLLLARDLGYLGDEPLRSMARDLESVMRMLAALLTKLDERPPRVRKR
jgi:four helix bundle protein